MNSLRVYVPTILVSIRLANADLALLCARAPLGLILLLATPITAHAAPIHDAVLKGDPRAVAKALHDDPASVNAEDEKLPLPIQIAAYSGNKDIVNILLARGAKWDVYSAAGLGNTTRLEEFLKVAPKLANSSDQYGASPLDYAVERHQLEAARILLDHKADANAPCGTPGGERVPPLYFAVFNGDLPMVELLLERGADIHFKDMNDETLLHEAAFSTRPIMALLLDHKLNVNAKSKYGETPLHHAAFGGRTQLAALLLERGADINAQDREGHTPIHVAAVQGKIETTAFLLGKGAKLDFAAAVRLNRIDEARAMLKQDPNLSRGVAGENRPLNEAAAYGYMAMVKLLLDNGAGADDGADRALSVAAGSGRLEIATLLLESGANVDAKTNMPPLMEAAANGNTDVARLLLEHKAALYGVDAHPKDAPLVQAAQGGHLDTVRLLLAVDKDGGRSRAQGALTWLDLALEYAVGNGRTKVAELLIERGADIRTSLFDDTLLCKSARAGNAETAELLLNKGAKVDATRPADGRTPLHEAAKANQRNSVKLLLDHRADPDLKDAMGDTPLHLAAKHADLPVVQLLLDHQANAKAVNKAGKLPWELAEDEGQDEIAALLRKAAEK